LSCSTASGGRRLKAALATLLLEARAERQLARLRSQLAKLDPLVLDELG
jgi:hypothetical protein